MNRVSTLLSYLAFCAMLLGTWGCKPQKHLSTLPESMEMKAYQEPAYSLSLPIVPRKTLLKALDKAGREMRIVKIPVVVRIAADGLRAWEDAFVGADENMADEDKIRLRLNDSHLGLSLADRIHQYCPDGKWCKLWLTGLWMQESPVIDADSDPTRFPFSIRAVTSAQKEGEQPIVYFAAQ